MNAKWVGLALSLDTSMGDDSVIECVYQNGIVTAHTSLTTRGEGNYGANRTRVVCLIVFKTFL